MASGLFAGAVSGGGQAAAASGGNPYAAAAGAVLGGIQGALGDKQKAEMRKAARAQRRIEQLNAMRERVSTQRQANAQRAEVVQAAANESGSNDSATQGTLSGMGSQLNAAFGYANAVDYQSSIIRKASRKAQYAGDRSAMVGNLLQAGVSVLGSMPSGAAPAGADAGKSLVGGNLDLQPAAPSFFYNDGNPAAPSFFSDSPVFKL